MLWTPSNFSDVTWWCYRSRALRGRILQEIQIIQNLDLNLFSFTSVSKHVYSCTDRGLKRLKHVTLTRQGTSETSLTYTLMITTDHNKSTNVTDVHPCHTCLITHPPPQKAGLNKTNEIESFFSFFLMSEIYLSVTLWSTCKTGTDDSGKNMKRLYKSYSTRHWTDSRFSRLIMLSA